MKEKDYTNILRKNLLDACQASYIPNVIQAQNNIRELPNDWLIKNIHLMASKILNLSDEWEYRRLLELYQMLDKTLLTKLIAFGLESNNDAVREAANDFRRE